jgi:hypothetical protein
VNDSVGIGLLALLSNPSIYDYPPRIARMPYYFPPPFYHLVVLFCTDPTTEFINLSSPLQQN